MDTTLRDIFISATIESLPPKERYFLLAEGNKYIVAVLIRSDADPIAYYIGNQAECLIAARSAKATENYPCLSDCDLGEIKWILFTCQAIKSP